MSHTKDKPITPSYVRSSIKRYQENSVKRVVIIFHYDTDAVLIEKLNSLKNMSSYIKNLISMDIKENPDLPLNEEKKVASRRYSNSKKKRVSFLVNKTDEADILKRLEAKKNMNDYVKELMVRDLAASKKAKEDDAPL